MKKFEKFCKEFSQIYTGTTEEEIIQNLSLENDEISKPI